MWSDLNALKDAISMSGKERSRQRLKSFINEIEQSTMSFTDEEFAMLKRIVERRGCDAGHMTAEPIDTALPCSPRSRISETSFDAHVYMERNDEKGRMVPEQDQLESPSAGTDFHKTLTAVSPELGDGMNHCRRLLAHRHKFEFGGNPFSPHRTRYRDAKRWCNYHTGSLIKNRFPADKTET